jgi:ATP-dependent RNA helicase DeaD
MTDEPPTGPAPGTRPRASRKDRRIFHRGEGRKDFGDRHGKKFGDDKPFENRKARREKMFGDKKFHKDHDERSFGDKPFRKTRRFGRV